MLCPECEKRRIAEGHKTCYPCHVRSVGFRFVGGGGYGRQAFHERTTNEFLTRFAGDPKNNPNLEHTP